jgi:hypothetical protein
MSKLDWEQHAFPLQQVTVQLQGARHSDRQAIVAQLEIVLVRLRLGEIRGHDRDDDFGYRFKVENSVNGPSFFQEPFGRELIGNQHGKTVPR